MPLFSCSNQDSCGRTGCNTSNNSLEKACIQVKKVFDACLSQSTNKNVQVTLSNLEPECPCLPLTFISGRTLSATGKIVSQIITPIPDRPHLSRVQATIEVPLSILYRDANGVFGKGVGVMTVVEDVILCVPDSSIVPFEVVAVVGGIVPTGSYCQCYDFSVNVCLSIILKVVMDVEISVPTYGYCKVPPCQPYSEELCTHFFELPLYPEK